MSFSLCTDARYGHGRDNVEKVARNPTGVRKGNENYTEEMREIAGHVRMLGADRHAYPEAIERAEALGFDLMPDETYVQSFMRSVRKLKKTL